MSDTLFGYPVIYTEMGPIPVDEIVLGADVTFPSEVLTDLKGHERLDIYWGADSYHFRIDEQGNLHPLEQGFEDD